ncbi:MAG: hypothetical protein AB7Q69_09460 [Gemmatimonadales bacterium]
MSDSNPHPPHPRLRIGLGLLLGSSLVPTGYWLFLGISNLVDPEAAGQQAGRILGYTTFLLAGMYGAANRRRWGWILAVLWGCILSYVYWAVVVMFDTSFQTSGFVFAFLLAALMATAGTITLLTRPVRELFVRHRKNDTLRNRADR